MSSAAGGDPADNNNLNDLTHSISYASILRDIHDDPEDAEQSVDSDDEAVSAPRPGELAQGYTIAGSYQRPSFFAVGASRATVVPSSGAPDGGYLTKNERAAVREEERSLLRDNAVIPPKHPRSASNASGSGTKSTTNFLNSLRKKYSSTNVGSTAEGDAADEEEAVDENTPLAPSELPYGGQDTPENIDKKWDEAVEAGMIHTTWQREAKVLTKYSRPLIVTFLLQYSLTVTSIFTVGHLGKKELGGVTLGSMTANITGYAVYHGLSTSLDTLCAQAYGSGRKKLVGLQLQRMVFFLWTITIPIGIIWLSGTQILQAIVPEKDIAALAGLYLKIALPGAPGYAAFEAGKRFVQAQGLFSATFYVLAVVAPINVFLHWFLVWHLNLGFIGAPIALTITELLLPIGLFLYVRFVDGRQCWGGFTRAAFTNWMPMIKLALPGLVMVLAEFLAFEMITLSSSLISDTHLAAQAILNTICIITFQLPFPMSIAASTRIANLIGATLAPAALTTAKVAMVGAVLIGTFNITLLSSLRFHLPKLFTNEEDVIEMVGRVLPLCAAFQLFDAMACHCNGILRGIGRQDIGGWVGLFCYYVVAMPISFGTGFGLKWELYGLWAGPAVALGLVTIIESYFIWTYDWQKAVEAAKKRNSVV